MRSAFAKQKDCDGIFVLDRPRHADLIAEIRASGAHVILRPDGDIVRALMVCTPSGEVDILMDTGGCPEGLLAVFAVKSLAGAMLGRLTPQSDRERNNILKTGYDLKTIFHADDLVKSEPNFFILETSGSRAFTRMKALANKHQFLPVKGMKRGGVEVVAGR